MKQDMSTIGIVKHKVSLGGKASLHWGVGHNKRTTQCGMKGPMKQGVSIIGIVKHKVSLGGKARLYWERGGRTQENYPLWYEGTDKAGRVYYRNSKTRGKFGRISLGLRWLLMYITIPDYCT